jgi:hypothetical protein
MFPHTNIASINRSLGGSETQTDVLVPSSATLAWPRRLGLDLRVQEDMGLLLERTLRLDCKLRRHDCLRRFFRSNKLAGERRRGVVDVNVVASVEVDGFC